MAYVDRVLGAGEEKLYITRRHVVFLLARILLRALLVIVAVGLGIFLKTKIHNPTAGTISLLVLLAVALIFAIQIVVLTLEWNNEQYVVTGRRVIQAKGIFAKHMMDSSLNMINDIVLDQSVWGRLLGFGDIQIITGNDDENRLRGLQDPFAFKRALLAAKEQMAMAYASGQRPGPPNSTVTAQMPAPPHDDIPTLIAQLADLRDRGAISQVEFDTKREELLRRL
jgi:uncharacterized membrane protein YdbT with pleckstrin-like domain